MENQREGTKAWKVKQKTCIFWQKNEGTVSKKVSPYKGQCVLQNLTEVKDYCLNVTSCYGVSDGRKLASPAVSK